jgi:hypothetical protein
LEKFSVNLNTNTSFWYDIRENLKILRQSTSDSVYDEVVLLVKPIKISSYEDRKGKKVKVNLVRKTLFRKALRRVPKIIGFGGLG